MRQDDVVDLSPMFEQLAVIHTTAFLRRTSAPVFSPIYDGWENQPFNATRFPVDVDTRLRARVRAHIVLPVKRSIVRAVPRRVRRALKSDGNDAGHN
jgi:hypothetical protein